MAAAATDLLQKVAIATATTLDAPGYTIGNTSITVASTSTWPTDTGITFAIDEVDANGDRVANSYNEYVGTVASGTSVTNVSHVNGTDKNYSAGSTTRVYIPVSEERENRIVTWGTTEHTQLGKHNFTTVLDSNGNESLKLGVTAAAVNEVTITNASTGNFPTISATGEADTGIDFENSEGEEILKLDAIASAVNEITIKNAATGNDPEIQATGDDTNIDVNIVPKGTGRIAWAGNVTYPPTAFARKTAAEDVTSSTVYQNDDDLKFNIGASEVWTFKAVLGVDGGTTGDIKFQFTVPASATGKVIYCLASAAQAADNNKGGDITVSVGMGLDGSGTENSVLIEGIVVNSTNAGTVQLQWAQNASSATATSVNAGSYIMATKVT